MGKITKSKKNRIWRVDATSESGDDYGTLETFDHEPTEEELKAITHESVIGSDGWDEEMPPGPGYNGSWLHLHIW